MSARPVLVDTTRLITRLKHANPTGIDRVDLAYARHYLDRPSTNQAIAATSVGVRLLPRARSVSLIEQVAARWQETTAGSDPGLSRLQHWLSTPPRPPERSTGVPAGSSPARFALGAPVRAARALGWPSAAAAPRDAIYIHTSHLGLDRPHLFAWLDGRPDIKAVFFVHDLIPIDFPEYGRPGEAERHRRRMATVAERAAAVITNSQDVADTLDRHLATERARRVPITVAPLGVETAFAGSVPPMEAARPYFVMLSTIEARKNHLLVLQIWRELARALGEATPALVVLGRRGWESEAAVDLLDRCTAIRPHVIEAGGLATASVATVLAGARALLMPSFAEGYGIPVVEALSLGTPVIASDIAAHREISKGHATLVAPLDGTGWREAILAAMRHRERDAGPLPFRPPTWRDHFARVDARLAEL